MNKGFKGFTLMEVLITAVLIGIIAAFAIPSFNKAINTNRERSVLQGCRSLQGALEVYKAKNGTYYIHDSGWLGMADVGLGALGVALEVDFYIEDNIDYHYQSDAAGTTYVLHCDDVLLGYELELTESSGPCCQFGVCPTYGGCP